MRFLEQVRAGSRRLAVELGCLGLLALVATTLPPSSTPITGWDLMAPALAILGHVLLGLLVLAEAAILVVRTRRVATRGHVSLPALGLAAVMVAVAAGAAFVVGAPRADIRVAMGVGWLVALAAYVAQWRRTSMALRRLATLRARDPLAPGSTGAGVPYSVGLDRGRERRDDGQGRQGAEEAGAVRGA